MTKLLRTSTCAAALLPACTLARTAVAEDDDQDHDVGVRSTVPAIAGQRTPVYVREVVRAASALCDRSVNAMWEKDHRPLFQASLEWLTKGAINGAEEGKVRLGY
jgi:hypothetical protein